MMMENCCYGQYELAILNMIRQGLFGEIIHCEGGYEHDLRGIANQLRRQYQRSYHHMNRNADLYPTHEIGPISKYLNINRGNRFLTLTSTASKSRGLDIRAAEIYGEQNPIWASPRPGRYRDHRSEMRRRRNRDHHARYLSPKAILPRQCGAWHKGHLDGAEPFGLF